jgi:hypothetical protein
MIFCKTEEEYLSRESLTSLLKKRTDLPDEAEQVFEESSNPRKPSLPPPAPGRLTKVRLRGMANGILLTLSSSHFDLERAQRKFDHNG